VVSRRASHRANLLVNRLTSPRDNRQVSLPVSPLVSPRIPLVNRLASPRDNRQVSLPVSPLVSPRVLLVSLQGNLLGSLRINLRVSHLLSLLVNLPVNLVRSRRVSLLANPRVPRVSLRVSHRDSLLHNQAGNRLDSQQLSHRVSQAGSLLVNRLVNQVHSPRLSQVYRQGNLRVSPHVNLLASPQVSQQFSQVYRLVSRLRSLQVSLHASQAHSHLPNLPRSPVCRQANQARSHRANLRKRPQVNPPVVPVCGHLRSLPASQVGSPLLFLRVLLVSLQVNQAGSLLPNHQVNQVGNRRVHLPVLQDSHLGNRLLNQVHSLRRSQVYRLDSLVRSPQDSPLPNLQVNQVGNHQVHLPVLQDSHQVSLLVYQAHSLRRSQAFQLASPLHNRPVRQGSPALNHQVRGDVCMRCF